MSTILGVGTQISFGSGDSDLVEAIRQSTQESTNQAGQQIVQKGISIQPTLTVRPGWNFRVVLSKELVLAPYRECPMGIKLPKLAARETLELMITVAQA